MRCLHRGNHAELREARDILRTQHLRVLDPKAMVGFRNFLQRRIERVEYDAVTAISDRMYVHLKAATQRGLGPGANVLRSRNEQPRVRRVVAVRREQSGTTRAKRAIGVKLDGANPQMSVVQRALRSTLNVWISYRRR